MENTEPIKFITFKQSTVGIFYKKWGMVAFGGLGIATDDFEGNNYSGILPSIGTGIRFKAIKSRNINIGVDIAKGKDDWGLYFRIGEAFTM